MFVELSKIKAVLLTSVGGIFLEQKSSFWILNCGLEVFQASPRCRFSKTEEADAAKAVFNGREFDGNIVTAKEAPEEEFDRANAGQWTGAYDIPTVAY